VGGLQPRRVVLGGVGLSSVLELRDAEAVARAATDTVDPRVGAVLASGVMSPDALRAPASILPTSATELAALSAKVLVLCGRADDSMGSPQDLAALLPDASVVLTPGDHRTAALGRDFAEALVRFVCDGARGKVTGAI
jgi:hypothetical protein